MPCPAFDLNRLPLGDAGGLLPLLEQVVDPRKARGVRHSVVTVVAIAVCAALCGARSYCAIAEWAHGLGPEALRQLGATRRQPPSEPTIRRVLQKLDADALDRQLSAWMVSLEPAVGRAIAVDGKTLRGSRDGDRPALQLISAILHQEGMVVAQRAVGDHTNEIPELRTLLAPLPMKDAVMTADALHTQPKTARFIVEEKEADFLLIVKDNQPTLRQEIAEWEFGAFPPRGHHD